MSDGLQVESVGRDRALVTFIRTVLEAARNEWDGRVVTEPGTHFNPRLLYTETHFALAALLVFLSDRTDRSWLDLAESRLRLWNQGPVPLTFFNAMAICVAAILWNRSGEQHDGLQSILEELVANTREHRHPAYRQWCGNNAYLQQIAVDTILLPLARGREVDGEGLDLLLASFRTYRTPEGVFFDLPREGTAQEHLLPPTYIMKMLFLAGLCHTLFPQEDLVFMFRSGMASLLPFFTCEGSLSYFGRTDNSPFAAGLTIFNLRMAIELSREHGREFRDVCSSAERYFRTYPRTPSGMLQCNRFHDPESDADLYRSRDHYAYVGQYTVSSCAYAMLGCYLFPDSASSIDAENASLPARTTEAVSKDLRLVKLSSRNSEVFLRTGSEITGWDRRYLGPTILRYQVGSQLLIGAISRSLSTDRDSEDSNHLSRVRKAMTLLRYRFARGFDQLDGASVGFLPVVRHGAVDYLPYNILSLETSPSHLRTRYQMVRLRARGAIPLLIEVMELLHQNVPGWGPKRYTRPRMRLDDSIVCSRDVYLQKGSCRVEDRLVGPLRGKTVLFSVRAFPCATISVQGLKKQQSMIGWGSDGRQRIEVYAGEPNDSEFRYACVIEPAERSPSAVSTAVPQA